MAENPTVMRIELKGGTPEVVAYALLENLLEARRLGAAAKGRDSWMPSKDWLLGHFAECLTLVRTGMVSNPAVSSAIGRASRGLPVRPARAPSSRQLQSYGDQDDATEDDW